MTNRRANGFAMQVGEDQERPDLKASGTQVPPRANPLLARVSPPPIAQADRWVAKT